jgi:hypothetical protein
MLGITRIKSEPHLENNMNWLIIALDTLFALFAAVLAILSLRTYRSIKNLGIGKYFWMPIFLSSILFVLGPIVRIFHAFAVEYGLGVLAYTEEVIHISWLIGIVILFVSIYSYSVKVKSSIRVVTPETQGDTELKGLNKQANDLLKEIEKLKTKTKSN